MDGLLIVDKPEGPTSHDVVARVRRALGQPRIGHTGTLDPMASGVLPLVMGRATRLAQFLSASSKEYDATVCLGVETDTYDAMGDPVGERHIDALPPRDAIERAIEAFRGTFEQRPPAFSAKKIGGRRSYRLARERAGRATQAALLDSPPPSVGPAPVRVTVHQLEIVKIDGPLVRLRVACTAGFYVRSLAHDLGRALGTGAHLAALRRTASGPFTLRHAVTLDQIDANPAAAAADAVPMRALLPELPSATLTAEGVRRAAHGRELGADDFITCDAAAPAVRLLDVSGELVGIASPGRGPALLHPSIILR